MSYYGDFRFILKRIVLKKHTVFGESFEVNFTDDNDFKKGNVYDSPYTSLIIGPNGTGKSFLLKEISDVFLNLRRAKEKGDSFAKLSGSYFEVTYSLFGLNYMVTNFKEVGDKIKRLPITILENGKDVSLSKIHLPENVVVSSLLLNDKFTISNEFPEFYKYLGVRSLKSPSVARTKNYIKRTVDLVLDKLSSTETEVIYKIKDLLSFLKYEESFGLTYKLRYKEKFFFGQLTSERFNQLFEKFNDENDGFSKRKNSEFIPYGVQYFNSKVKGNLELISNIVEFINYIYYEMNNDLSFDIINNKLPLNYYGLLNHLNSLDLITFPTLYLKKDGTPLNIEQTSSGEYHILSSFIGIYASLNHNSLVIIDEPEISLHPNWQMGYISFLKKIFKDYPNCHFVITSHSHFFASDLDGNSSRIIGLKRDNDNKIANVDLPKDINTYGWSAEDILYNIFNVRSFYNHYLEADLTELLGMIANNGNDYDKIKMIVEKLENLPKREHDPLQDIIIEANEFLKERL